MNELPSTEFRRTFARLREQTVVTVNGHVIGIWVPKSPAFAEVPGQHALDFPVIDGLATLPNGQRLATTSQVVRVPTARFNSQPFTGPIPKGGKPAR